jgi:sulfatase modifying factor 1
MILSIIVPELVLVPAGTFLMGNDGGRADERPAHSVTLEAFRAGVRPVTNAAYGAFVEATGHEPAPFVADPRFGAPDQPVSGVSWYDAVAYCDWLTRTSGTRYRLPTEAEREYAALGGLEAGDWPWGKDPHPNPLPVGEGIRGWSSASLVAERAEIARLDHPHVPREECANGYGLLCMADNVHEWCSDWYDAAYYARSPKAAPGGPERGSRRASRGGSWRHQVKFTRLSARSSLDPTYRYNDYGFRIYADA